MHVRLGVKRLLLLPNFIPHWNVPANFLELPSMKRRKNPFTSSCVVKYGQMDRQTDRQTDRQVETSKLTCAFFLQLFIANMIKNST
jgi:hypothetical protein